MASIYGDIGGFQNKNTTAQNKLNDTIATAENKRRRRSSKNQSDAPQVQGPVQQVQGPVQPSKPTPTPSPKELPQSVYFQGNVYTTDGKVYGAANKNFVPAGYQRGQLNKVTTTYSLRDTSTGKTTTGSFNEYNISKRKYQSKSTSAKPLNTSLPWMKDGTTTDTVSRSSTSSSGNLDSSESKQNFVQKGLNKWSNLGTNTVNKWGTAYDNSKGIDKFGTGTGLFFSRLLITPITQLPKAAYTILTSSPGQNIARIDYFSSKEFIKTDIPQYFTKTRKVEIAADIAGVLTPTSKITKAVKNEYIKLGATEVKSTEVLGEVTSTSKAEIIQKFQKSIKNDMYQGVHTTSSTFSEFKKPNADNMKASRIEDSGVFIADWGSANKRWLNIGNKKSKFTLNPLKNLGNNPNIIKVEFENLAELPKNIVNKAKSMPRTPAYETVNKWYEKFAKPSTAYVPLRTELWETPETQVVLPFKYPVKIEREGNILQRIKGFKEYTVIDGEVVPIRKFKPAGKSTPSSKIINIEDINSKYKNYYDYEPVNYKSPYGSIYKSYKGAYNKGYGGRYRSNSGLSYSYPKLYTPTHTHIPSVPKPSILRITPYLSKGGRPYSYPKYNSPIVNPPRVPTLTPFNRDEKRKLRTGTEKYGTTKDLTEAYKVILKKGKREKEVAGLYSRADALRIGQSRTLSSLFARFKIEKTPYKIKKGLNDFKVNPRLFRPYRIENRKPISLTNEFIQRRGQRLSNALEVAEIQSHRRRK